MADLIRIKDRNGNLFNFNHKDAADFMSANAGAVEVPRPVPAEDGSAGSESRAQAIAKAARIAELRAEGAANPGVDLTPVLDAIKDISNRLAALEGNGGGAEEPTDVEDMTRKQLEEHAAEKGIDIAGAKNKAEILEAINAAAEA